MSLKEENIIMGNWLFKFRSYVPLLILPFLFYFIQLGNYKRYDSELLIISILISYIGEIIRFYTVGTVPYDTSGRNTKQQHAGSLNKYGIYSVVRHPLYLGNFLIYIGPFIYTANIFANIVFILLFWIYYEKIMYAEEDYLFKKFNNKFSDWALNTPAFIPNIKLLNNTDITFSYKKALLREYAGIFGIAFIYFTIIVYKSYINHGVIKISDYWVYYFLFNAFIYICIRLIKKTSF